MTLKQPPAKQGSYNWAEYGDANLVVLSRFVIINPIVKRRRPMNIVSASTDVPCPCSQLRFCQVRTKYIRVSMVIMLVGYMPLMIDPLYMEQSVALRRAYMRLVRTRSAGYTNYDVNHV